MLEKMLCVFVAILVLGGVGSVAPAYADPVFGKGCVSLKEFKQVKRLGVGTPRKRVERIFGARGIPGANMHGLNGSFRAYRPCNEAAWDARYGDGPAYWIVLAQYRDGHLVRLTKTNKGYRP